MTDDAGYAEFVHARWPALFRTTHLLTGDRAQAEDVLQAVLIKAYTRWDRVSRAEVPEAYVRCMLLREVLSARRTAARRSGRRHLVATPEVWRDVDPTERPDLWARLQSLPPRQRAVVVLRYYDDLSEAQIAETLGIATGTVKSQASDALRTLRAGYSNDTDSTDEVTR
jgi:RNA polymerase sigma-70 factor (sigma-E family)